MILRFTPLVALLLALAISACAPPKTIPFERAALPLHPISDRIWYVEGESGMASRENRGFMSNAGFVVTDDGVVVFDALATPALAESLVASIRTVTAQPVRLLILSHYHADHLYGAQVFKAAGAEIWARQEGQTSRSVSIAAAFASSCSTAATHILPAI